jgi:DNA replication and repair protein RecF
MIIKTIALTNFRNYRKQSVTLGPGLNFIIGPNGEGKTNFLEAIYTLSLVKSYKAPDQDLVLIGSDVARIAATLQAKEKDLELTVAFSPEGKTAAFNHSPAHRLSDYIGVMNVVLFTPEDINLVKGGPSERRYFLDLILGQTDRGYLRELIQYKHVLKQRNELLRQMQERRSDDKALLDILSEQLVRAGNVLISKRKAFLDWMNLHAGKMYGFLTSKDELLTVEYLPSVVHEFAEELLDKYSTDQMSGTTNVGPHRDDIAWQVGGQPAKNFASQGEQRMIVLSVNMALCDFIAQAKEDRPIFLLDDVFSELDSVRQNRLIQYLTDSGNQAVITATSLSEIDEIFVKQAKVFQVLKGSIREDRYHGQH